MPEADKPFETYQPRLFPRIQRIGEALTHLSFLPQIPLATHGDTLPHDLAEPVEPQE